MNVWQVRCGKYGEREELALERGLAVLGFRSMPDLSQASTNAEMRALADRHYPDSPSARISNYTGQLLSFAHRMETGDIVALPKKSDGTIALGRVDGPYKYVTDLGDVRHVRPVKWIRTDVPKTEFGQDLRLSLGSISTVCRIQRNNAGQRFEAVMNGQKDPGMADTASSPEEVSDPTDDQAQTDIEQLARDQIHEHISKNFRSHDLARLVDAVLQAEGYETRLSPPGPDGGVDILAGRGALGFESPRLCVQVKSGVTKSDVTVFRALQGTMQTFQAEQGLLVSWGGFNGPVRKEARVSYFSVRLWDAVDLIEAVFKNFEELPEEIQTEIPLKRVWTLVLDE